MRFGSWRTAFSVFLLLAARQVVPCGTAQETAHSTKTASGITFTPLQQWEAAVTGGDAAALRALYSSAPPARVNTPAGDLNADGDAAFWANLKVRSLKLDLIQSDSPQSGLRQIVFQAEIHSAAPSSRTLYLSEGQMWQDQGGQWRLVTAKRTDPARLQQPVSLDNEIYPSGADARAEVKHAVAETKGYKRVLVVFGANWCYDCHVLDLAFHRSDLAAVLQKDYELVHVDVGRGDKNQDLMQQYHVPMKRGIPAIAVLDSTGTLLFSQENGEFENARSLAPEDLLQFLNKWKPRAR